LREFVDWLGQSEFSLGLAQSGWVTPTVQTIHILAIAVIVSSVLMIDLRVMGFAGRSQTLRDTSRRFAPWFWGALIVLALTGVAMIVTEPVRSLLAISFWVKMAALAVGIAVAIWFLRSLERNDAYREETQEVRLRTKAFGIATLLIWVVIIFLGRFIAYDYQLWGRLSPLYIE
jgi:uncharacterized membrane protein